MVPVSPTPDACSATSSVARRVALRLQREVRQAWHYASARRTCADAIGQVETFVLFVGYPRSGHSIVAALLNAHPDALISHELDASRYIARGCSRQALFARIMARAAWFHDNGSLSIYPYAVPNQWQGRFRRLRVIGDKRGGAVTRMIAERPDFLARTASIVGVPVKLIHVVRNPFDNVATIARRHGMDLEQATGFYFRHADTTRQLCRTVSPDALMTLRHEELVRDPEAVLTRLCEFLGLEVDADYLKDCAAVLFRRPHLSRDGADWPQGLVGAIEGRLQDYPLLAVYSFDR